MERYWLEVTLRLGVEADARVVQEQTAAYREAVAADLAKDLDPDFRLVRVRVLRESGEEVTG